MTCHKPANLLLECNIDELTKIKRSFIDVIYTDLLLNQFSIYTDFKILLKEINVSSLYDNILLVCDAITESVLRQMLPKSNNLHIVNGQTLLDQFEGNGTKSSKRKVLKRQNPNAFRLDEINTFKHNERQTVVLLINVYKTFYVQRLTEDNDRTRLKNIYVILNSLVEFPFIYTLDVPFKILLYNDISKNDVNCNYVHVSSRSSKVVVLSNNNNTLAAGSSLHIEELTVNDLISKMSVHIDREKVYVLNLSNVKKLDDNVQVYRVFKMFYYTYCFNGAKWSVFPNDKDYDTLYVFKRYFDEEISIISKWWPNNETISTALMKLKSWCPQIFGDINDWFFHCNVREIFSTTTTVTSSTSPLPRIRSRPLLAGGHIWQTTTLAYMCLNTIALGSANLMHMLSEDTQNLSKKNMVGYYKYLFDVEITTTF